MLLSKTRTKKKCDMEVYLKNIIKKIQTIWYQKRRKQKERKWKTPIEAEQ